MEHEPKIPQWSTADQSSFAYPTVRSRWPIIITQVIDDVYRSVSKSEGEKLEEGKKIVKALAEMKYELEHNRNLSPIDDDGKPDTALYNKELEQLGNPMWHNLPWLYAECYFYRRINSYFFLSSHWSTYDVFARQKLSAFRSSRTAVLELASRYKTLLTQLEEHKATPLDPAAEELLFREMCEICLWGNATDLSLLISLSHDNLQKLQGTVARKNSAENHTLVNDLDQAYAKLRSSLEAGKAERRVDIVLDNAGFELFADLVLAGYLLSAGLATTVVLHPKAMPWFVSDVVPADFAALLSALADPRTFYETPKEDEQLQDKVPAKLTEAEVADLGFLFANWANHHAEGRLVVRPHTFWTHPGSFWRLPAEAPELFEDLKQAELVIFKGDLNYRKLCADATWDPTTPFTKAIGPLGPGSGVNVLTLRTCKGDIVVGLKPGEDEKLRAIEDGGGDSGQRRWAWSGKWAIASFSDGS